MTPTLSAPESVVQDETVLRVGGPWVTIVWNDPVNLMSYVVRVFRQYFGYPQPQSYELMLCMHNTGHAVVANGTREEMERHVEALHEYGLWATLERDH